MPAVDDKKDAKQSRQETQAQPQTQSQNQSQQVAKPKKRFRILVGSYMEEIGRTPPVLDRDGRVVVESRPIERKHRPRGTQGYQEGDEIIETDTDLDVKFNVPGYPKKFERLSETGHDIAFRRRKNYAAMHEKTLDDIIASNEIPGEFKTREEKIAAIERWDES